MVDAADLSGDFESVQKLPVGVRIVPLARIARRLADLKRDDPLKQRVVGALVAVVEEGIGTSIERIEVGEALGALGDPRIKVPTDADYWVDATTDDGPVRIGRFPVTNFEYRAWADGGGYTDRAAWSAEGWEWLATCKDPWPVRAQAADARPFVIPNQPVVCVTWWEADAYARSHGARLPRFDERLRVVRGPARRPYPWGSPFGEGNANTREEVIGRPSAVGLYVRDRTPEGVADLAGNVAEWAADGSGDQRWYAPGAWDQPSMAAWAKARESEAPHARWPGLGFRLCLAADPG